MLARGQQGRTEDILRVRDQASGEVVEEAGSEQIVGQNEAIHRRCILLNKAFERSSRTGEKADGDGAAEFLRQEFPHLATGFVGALVTRTRCSEDDLVVSAQRWETFGEDPRKSGVWSQCRGQADVAGGISGTGGRLGGVRVIGTSGRLGGVRVIGTSGRLGGVRVIGTSGRLGGVRVIGTIGFLRTNDRRGEVDVYVISGREQQRDEHDGSIMWQTIDHLVDIGLLDIHVPEHHLVDEPAFAQITGHRGRECFDETLPDGR